MISSLCNYVVCQTFPSELAKKSQPGCASLMAGMLPAKGRCLTPKPGRLRGECLIHLLAHMNTNQQAYRKLCEAENPIPILNQAWWLDATVGADS